MDIQIQLPTQPTTASPSRSFLFLKVLVVLVVLGVTAWLAFGRDADTPADTVFSLLAPQTASVGAEFTVQLKLNSAALEVTAAQLAFTYDTYLLELVSIAPGELLPIVLVYPDVGDGYANLTAGSGTAPLPGPGTVATLVFRAVRAGDASISLLTSSQAAATDHAGNVLNALPPASVLVR